MQLALIFGIVIAMGAVVFALQNNIPVTVTLALWRYDGSLAMLLLIALGLGVLVAGLLSSPAVIRGKWTISRLKRQVVDVEKRLAEQEKRNIELAAALAARPQPESLDPVETAADKPYVGLRTLLGGARETPAAKPGADQPVP